MEYRQNTNHSKIIANGGGNSHEALSERATNQNRDDDGKFSENGLPSSGKGDKINLTKQEWAQYYKMLGDEQHGDFVYRTKSGGRCVRLQSKIIIDNGDFIAPAVTGVIEFASNDELNIMLNKLAAEGIIQ